MTESAARRPGVSSTPEKPEVEVPAVDALVDRGVGDLDESRHAPHPPPELGGDLDVETAELRRVFRVGFHEGRAPFGVAAPAKLGRRGRQRPAQGQGEGRTRQEAERPTAERRGRVR